VRVFIVGEGWVWLRVGGPDGLGFRVSWRLRSQEMGLIGLSGVWALPESAEGTVAQGRNKFTLGPSICCPVRFSSLGRKTGYEGSPKLQNRAKKVPRQYCARFWMTWRLRGSL
jgi:hypothetical protein